MGACSPWTSKGVALTIGLCASGLFLFSVGAHLSYLNVAPQQARTKARADFVRERLKKKHDK